VRRRTDEEVLADAVRTMRLYEAVAVTSLAREIGTTPQRLRRLVGASSELELWDGQRLHRREAMSPRSSVWVKGIANPRTLNNMHLVRFDATYVLSRRR